MPFWIHHEYQKPDLKNVHFNTPTGWIDGCTLKRQNLLPDEPLKINFIAI